MLEEKKRPVDTVPASESNQASGKIIYFSNWLPYDELSAIWGYMWQRNTVGTGGIDKQVAPNKKLEGVGQERGVKIGCPKLRRQ